MIDELEMGFFFDGPPAGSPESDGAQFPHDAYDGWTQTQSHPRQLSEGAFGSNFEMLERDMTHWGEIDHEWEPFENHDSTDGLSYSQLGEPCQVEQDWSHEDSMSAL